MNQIFNTDCVVGLRTLEADSVAMTCTSPPYDNQRDYRGVTWNFEQVATELWRVTMPGGVIAWNVQNQIEDGGETGTAEYQKLFFKSLGFKLYNTIIVDQPSQRANTGCFRYGTAPIYVHVLSKGSVRVWNPIKDKFNRWAGQENRRSSRRRDGTLMPNIHTGKYTKLMGTRGLIWRYPGRATRDPGVMQAAHGAVMPELLAYDLIRSWTNRHDLVLDPFMGLGTTAKMAAIQGRYYVGFEAVEEFYRISQDRLLGVGRHFFQPPRAG